MSSADSGGALKVSANKINASSSSAVCTPDECKKKEKMWCDILLNVQITCK